MSKFNVNNSTVAGAVVKKERRFKKVKSIKCPECGISNTIDSWDSHTMEEMGIKSEQNFMSSGSSIKVLVEQMAMFHCPMCNEELEGVKLIREYNETYNYDDEAELYRNGNFSMKPKAFGTFVKRGEYVFRTSAFIQWGDSDKSIGACLLLNPGSATLDKDLTLELYKVGFASGSVKTEDPTMEQLILIVEGIYGKDEPIIGRLHIYNLFSLQNTSSVNAVDQFELLVQSGEYDIKESLATISELEKHPWILLGWGVKKESRWTNLELIKKQWKVLIEKTNIPTFGKKHKNRDDYYHPCPLIPTRRPIIVDELISIYIQKINVQLNERRETNKRYTLLKWNGEHGAEAKFIVRDNYSFKQSLFIPGKCQDLFWFQSDLASDNALSDWEEFGEESFEKLESIAF